MDGRQSRDGRGVAAAVRTVRLDVSVLRWFAGDAIYERERGASRRAPDPLVRVMQDGEAAAMSIHVIMGTLDEPESGQLVDYLSRTRLTTPASVATVGTMSHRP